MSNTNILELPTLEDEALMDIVGGCGKPPCQPAPRAVHGTSASRRPAVTSRS